MEPNTTPSRFGDPSLWDEDVIWLAETRVQLALADYAPRVRWVHLYLEHAPGRSGVLARVQADVAGQDLASVCAIRSCPQAALCAACDLLRHELGRDAAVAV